MKNQISKTKLSNQAIATLMVTLQKRVVWSGFSALMRTTIDIFGRSAI